jgi:hypothetical protein
MVTDGVTKGVAQKLPKHFRIVGTYWHDYSLESSWGALSDGSIGSTILRRIYFINLWLPGKTRRKSLGLVLSWVFFIKFFFFFRDENIGGGLVMVWWSKISQGEILITLFVQLFLIPKCNFAGVGVGRMCNLRIISTLPLLFLMCVIMANKEDVLPQTHVYHLKSKDRNNDVILRLERCQIMPTKEVDPHQVRSHTM